MKNQRHNLTIFQEITGKTTVVPKSILQNPYGYQPSRVRRFEKWGMR